MKDTNTQWHPGFIGAMDLEFREDRNKLIFEKEHNLNTKPLQIDLLIIKKNPEAGSTGNEIGEIFRKYNILEYKSPDEHLDIDVFYKSQAYACLYKSYGNTVNERESDEITVSIVREGKPEGLFQYFKRRNIPIQNPYPGIYHILGEVMFPTQLIVTGELEANRHVWLRSLSRKMSEKDMRRMLWDVRQFKSKIDTESADSVLEVCLRENRQLIERMIGDDGMSDVLLEIMGPKINEMMESRVNKMVESKVNEIVELRSIEIRRQAKTEGIEQGIEQGFERGIEQGINYLVDTLRDYGHSNEEIKEAIIKKYHLSEGDADKYL